VGYESHHLESTAAYIVPHAPDAPGLHGALHTEASTYVSKQPLIKCKSYSFCAQNKVVPDFPSSVDVQQSISKDDTLYLPDARSLTLMMTA